MAVQAQVRYLNEAWRDRADVPEIGDRASRRANTAKHVVAIHDARPRLESGEIDLDVNGFALLPHVTKVRDFNDDAQIKAVYYPEMIALAKRATGAVEAFVIQHVLRTEDRTDFNKAYARFLHCDYSLKGARAAAERVLAKRGLALGDYAGKHFAWYNAWQPFDHPALRNPLALVDAASVPPEDLVDYRYTGYANARRAAAAGAGNGRAQGGDAAEAAMEGKSSMPARNPAHRFYYVPNMAPDELLFFKQLDTRRRGGACPHTSFDDPTSPPDAPPRRSIETRVMAVFAPAA